MSAPSAGLKARPIAIVSERLGPIGDQERRIEAAGAELLPAPLWSHDEIRDHGRGASVLLIGAVEPFDAKALALLPNCSAIVRRGVGVDNVDIDAATRLGILVANVPDASVEEVSDHALSLLLAIERRILPLDRAVHAGAWQHDPREIAAVRTGIRRFSDLVLGIVGFGRIGRALARKAAPVYGRIIVADPIATADVVKGLGGQLVSLEQLFEMADHISLHAPLDAGTYHLVGEASLAGIKPGAVIVNTSRGGLVDEAAVIRAVSSGRLAAAGLDVTEHEPLPPEDPLLAASGIILTAHSAATSTIATAELARRSVDAVVAIVESRRPDSIVNPEVLDAPNLRATDLREAG